MKLLVILGLLITACSGTVAAATTPTTTTTAIRATPTNPQSVPDSVTTMATTTTVSLDASCDAAIEESIATFGVLLDRVDSDPAGFVEGADEFTAISGDLGTLMGQGCGLEQGGRAFSELLVYLSQQSIERPALTVILIESTIEAFCGADLPVELNLQGRAVCTSVS